MINLKNQEKYEQYKKFHTEDGGKNPEAHATTEIIKDAIKEKTYKIYHGGGYEHKTENIIKNFDVVVTFSWGGDPSFQMCVDNSDGDACKIINSNPECTFVENYL